MVASNLGAHASVSHTIKTSRADLHPQILCKGISSS